MPSQTRSPRSWIVITLIVLPVLYVCSFGPACWISNRMAAGEQPLSIAYQPLLWLWMRTEGPAKVVQWYALLGTRDDSHSINTVDGRLEITW